MKLHREVSSMDAIAGLLELYPNRVTCVLERLLKKKYEPTKLRKKFSDNQNERFQAQKPAIVNLIKENFMLKRK